MDKTLGTWPRYNFRWSLSLAKKEEEKGEREMHISLCATLIGNVTLHEQEKQKNGKRNN